jgi:hypothetical protein
MKLPQRVQNQGVGEVSRTATTNPYDGKRIYCLVADTVQHPLEESKSMVSPHCVYKRTPETRTINQVAGRLMAQGEHAVSMVRHMLLRASLQDMLLAGVKSKNMKALNFFTASCFWPITTINLAVRDSFELFHIRRLLINAGIRWETFTDTNPDVYGDDGGVVTALATWPVEPDAMLGITDYLPLWVPRY